MLLLSWCFFLLNLKLLEELSCLQGSRQIRQGRQERPLMTTTEAPSIACTLNPGEFKDRLTWIGVLTRDALRSHERRDLVLHLRYAPEVAERVREMVRNEQTCCSFLAFDLHEAPDEIRLTITAPESAREAAGILFEQFVAGAPPSSACACVLPSASDATSPI